MKTKNLQNRLMEFYSPKYLSRLEQMAIDMGDTEANYSGQIDMCKHFTEEWHYKLLYGLYIDTVNGLHQGVINHVDEIEADRKYGDFLTYLITTYNLMYPPKDQQD